MRLAAALLMVPAMGAAQDLRQDTATFHADARLVEVNVVVHEKNRPVASLTRDDFVLTDRGTDRAIAVFSKVVSAADMGASHGGLPENTFSNREHAAADSPNGVTIILLDGMNTLYFSKDPLDKFMDTLRTDSMALAFARQQVIKFAKAIQPADRVAIYSLGRSLHVLSDFTNDAARLQKILASYTAVPAVSGDAAQPLPATLPESTGTFTGAIDGGNQSASDLVNASRAGVTIEALRSIADHVTGIPGRKNLIWLTAGMPFSGSIAARLVSRANIAIYPVDARGLPTSFNAPVSYRDPFVAGGIPRGANFAAGQLDMREAAEQTGGQAFLNNNDLSGAIREAIDDSAVTYTLGFYVDTKSLDGKFHDIKVRVKDPGMEVRYPRGYYALAQAPLAERLGGKNVDRIVLSPLESAEVHLVARVERIEQPLSFSISGSIDVKDIDLRPEGEVLTGSVEVYLIQQDSGGEVLDKEREKLALRLTRQEYAAYLRSGVFFRKVMPARTNVATLRVVAGDPRTAKMGSLIIPVSQVR